MTPRELVNAGYMQVSAKYRTVARLPEGKTGLEALRDADPYFYASMMDRIERQACAQYLRVYSTEADRLTLTQEELAAFRAAGGEAA